MPGREHERAHRDARRCHVDQERADAAMLRRCRVRAREQQDPVGELCTRGPDFLTVDHEPVAVLDGARLKAGQIRAGVRLGEALAPHLVRVQDRREIASLLLVGAPVNERRADQIQAHVSRQHRSARGGVLLVPDHALDQAGAAAAVFFRPRDADPTGGVHLRLPEAASLEGFAVRRHAIVGGIVEAQLGRQMLHEPVAELLAKLLVPGRVLEVHAQSRQSGLSPRTVTRCPCRRSG